MQSVCSMTVLLDPSIVSDLEGCRARLDKKATSEKANQGVIRLLQQQSRGICLRDSYLRHKILLQGHREWKSCCTCWQLSKSPTILKKEGSRAYDNGAGVQRPPIIMIEVERLWSCLQ
ncbi:hypothetical protein WJX77_005908 [Trebouxia sp. C0004]